MSWGLITSKVDGPAPIRKTRNSSQSEIPSLNHSNSCLWSHFVLLATQFTKIAASGSYRSRDPSRCDLGKSWKFPRRASPQHHRTRKPTPNLETVAYLKGPQPRSSLRCRTLLRPALPSPTRIRTSHPGSSQKCRRRRPLVPLATPTVAPSPAAPLRNRSRVRQRFDAYRHPPAQRFDLAVANAIAAIENGLHPRTRLS